jgi:hypothetical protein
LGFEFLHNDSGTFVTSVPIVAGTAFTDDGTIKAYLTKFRLETATET